MCILPAMDMYWTEQVLYSYSLVWEFSTGLVSTKAHLIVDLLCKSSHYLKLQHNGYVFNAHCIHPVAAQKMVPNHTTVINTTANTRLCCTFAAEHMLFFPLFRSLSHGLHSFPMLQLRRGFLCWIGRQPAQMLVCGKHAGSASGGNL